MASVLATVTMVVIMSAVIFLPRSFALAGGVTFHDWQQDRRLWSSLAIGSLLVWVGGVTGQVFESLGEPSVAESVSVLLTIMTGVGWLTLRRGHSKAYSSAGPIGDDESSSAFETFSSSQVQPSMSTRPSSSSADEQARMDSPPPGWYADPWGQAESRRWNGIEWTTDTGPMPGR